MLFFLTNYFAINYDRSTEARFLDKPSICQTLSSFYFTSLFSAIWICQQTMKCIGVYHRDFSSSNEDILHTNCYILD
ncbi:hypothetical protein CHUAL_005805 [Chamberlinius hualienensis]